MDFFFCSFSNECVVAATACSELHCTPAMYTVHSCIVLPWRMLSFTCTDMLHMTAIAAMLMCALTDLVDLGHRANYLFLHTGIRFWR